MKAVAVKSSAQDTLTGNHQGTNYKHTPVKKSISMFPGSAPLMQRKPICPCDGGCPRCSNAGVIQPKLTIGVPVDKYRQEANRRKRPVEPRRASNSEIGPGLGKLIDRSRPGGQLPASARFALSSIPRHTLESIRIHDDSAAHKAAQGLEARAFTLGTSIYFAQGEYQPTTQAGLRVLAHEAVHAHQQADASLPRTDRLVPEPPSSPRETEAESFVSALGTGKPLATKVQGKTTGAARLMRLTFDARPKRPNTFDIENRINPNASGPGGDGFGFGWGDDPTLFSWECDVQVNGTPEEEYSNWEVGVLQLMRNYWINFWWGEGPDQKHCGGTFGNIRDGYELSVPWFDKDTTSEPFTAAGDIRTTRIKDSPGALYIPYQNPEPGRNDTSGKFNFGASFVAYISARNRAAGYTPEAFRHLKSVYWNLSLAADFDASLRPDHDPIVKTDGGKTNAGGIIESYPKDDPPIIGGLLAFDMINTIAKCWR